MDALRAFAIFVTPGGAAAFGRLERVHIVPDRPKWLAERLAWPVAFGDTIAVGGAPAASPRTRWHARGTSPGTNPVPGPYISRGVS